MATTLSTEILQDNIAIPKGHAVSLARAMAVANKRADELGLDVDQSLISITQRGVNGGMVWRVTAQKITWGVVVVI
jgi:hypothetical protein